MNKKNVTYLFLKELKLVLLPAALLFTLSGLMLFIPSYPSSISLLYFFFPIQICFQMAKENKDLEFTMTMPVSRKEMVCAKHLLIIFIQLVQLFVCAVCAIIACLSLYKTGNPTSLDANLTFFGVGLIGFALFNFVFFVLHFKSGKNIAKPLILGVLAFALFIVGIEVIIALVPPLKSALDSLSGAFLWARILFLLFGLVLFVFSTLLSIKISSKRFEKVSL